MTFFALFTDGETKIQGLSDLLKAYTHAASLASKEEIMNQMLLFSVPLRCNEIPRAATNQ